jgi:hypothetical protein
MRAQDEVLGNGSQIVESPRDDTFEARRASGTQIPCSMYPSTLCWAVTCWPSGPRSLRKDQGAS